MADTAATVTDPRLTDRTPQPKGVLRKNLKIMLYMGAVANYSTYMEVNNLLSATQLRFCV